jgi:alcohol dehydrogenase (quinone), cytochrome c subunit
LGREGNSRAVPQESGRLDSLDATLKKSTRTLLALLGAATLVFLGALTCALLPTHTRQIAPSQSAGSDAASIERGRYLAVAADCGACHTAPGGKPFAGGLAIDSPLGAIYSTNITPDPESGIGKFSLDDFDRAVRHGIDDEGVTLYPAMPYPSYALMSDADIAALYSYFLHGVAPAASTEHANAIPWPLSIRWPVAIWRKLFAPSPIAPAFDASRYVDPVVARGAYLVQGPGHCGSCHTPRALTLQEASLDDSSPAFLAGGQQIGGWVAVNLRGNVGDGLGNWTKEDIVATLRTARNAEQSVIGAPMSEVVVHSTQNLTNADLQAMAAYLKTLAPSPERAPTFVANPATAAALAKGHEADRGAELYDDNCAACHHTDGAGSPKALPKIAGNSSALAQDPNSLIRLVLAGSALPGTTTAPSPLGMPGFGWRLSNEEVAQLVTFIRTNWGNHASSVTAGEVARVRGSLNEQNLPTTSVNR